MQEVEKELIKRKKEEEKAEQKHKDLMIKLKSAEEEEINVKKETIEIEKEPIKPLGEYTKELDRDILVFTSNKEPIAAMVPLKNVDKESLALSYNPDFMELIENARSEIRAGKVLSFEEMKDEVNRMDDD